MTLLLLACLLQDANALGHLDEAERALGGHGSFLYLPIGLARAKAGDLPGAERLFQKLLKAAPEQAVDVAIARVQVGDLHGALRLAESLPGDSRQHALRKMALQLTEAGRWEDARDIARRLEDNDRDGAPSGNTARREALSKIAAAQARAGDPEGAAGSLLEIGDAWLLDQAVAEIVRAFARRGEPDRALSMAEQLTLTCRIDILFELTAQGVVAALPKIRPLLSPFECRLSRPSSYVSDLARLAVALSKAGDPAGAATALRDAVLAAYGESDLVVIAQARLDLESFDAAGATARSIAEPWRRAYALLTLARRAPTRDQALALGQEAAALAEPETLRQIAGIFVDLDDLPAAIRSAETLLRRSEEGDLPLRIVRAQLKAGDLSGASDTLKRLFRSSGWSAARQELDLAHARAGEDRSGTFRAEVNAIAEALAKGHASRGDVSAARTALSRLDRYDVIRRAIHLLPEKEAVELAEAKGSYWKAAALLGIAEKLLQR